MDRDHASTIVHGVDDGRSRKGRLMGKLFGGRERKTSNEMHGNDDNINAFLHGPSASNVVTTGPANPPFDSLQVAHAGPPPLAKLDTRSISRYPNAFPVTNSSSQGHAPRASGTRSGFVATRPLRPGAHGLVVRFADTYPEIIGEGGDDSEIPTAQVSKVRQALSSRRDLAPPKSTDSDPFVAGPTRSLPLRSPLPPMPSLTQQSQHTGKQRPLEDEGDFVPTPIRRTQTGYSTISDKSSPVDWRPPISPERRRPPPAPEKIVAGQTDSALFLNGPVLRRDDQRRSFIELHQAEMREAEGLALANANREEVSPSSSPESDDEHRQAVSPIRLSPRKTSPSSLVPPLGYPLHSSASPHITSPHIKDPTHSTHKQEPDSSPILSPPSAAFANEWSTRQGRTRQVAQEYSPLSAPSPVAAVYPHANGFLEKGPQHALLHTAQNEAEESLISPEGSGSPVSPVSTSSPKPVIKDTADVAQTTSDDAFGTFVSRSRHLFELFRLQAESLQPLVSSTLDGIARAALWWFIVGRMSLENAFRERSAQGSSDSPISRTNEFAMQQAYADLAKAYWLTGEVFTEKLASGVQNDGPVDNQVDQVKSAIFSNLRKLSLSMKRNDLLPPEDAFLPQTIDKTIWVSYPPVSSDVTALLRGHWESSLAVSSACLPAMSMFENFPLADSPQDFMFSRMRAEVYLLEQGSREMSHTQQRFHFPCLLSVARPRISPTLEIIIASQNSTVQMRVQCKKNLGPTWEDIRWRSDMHSLEMRLPRGFMLAIQLSKQDFGLLWSMYDFGTKVHRQLFPRKDERPIFSTKLKAFQYFESGPPTGSFPKEAVPECDVAVFDKTLREGAATGPRSYHRGFRLAVVSGTRTRTLYGVSHTYLPDVPVQFIYLRGESGDPALHLRFENSRTKGSMALTFASAEERTELRNLLAGTALDRDEHIVVDVPLTGMDIRAASHALAQNKNTAMSAFKAIAFKRLRIINYDDEADDTHAPTVLSEKLRAVYENGDCMAVDRVNVAPGELRIRLDVRSSLNMAVLRQPQQDMTVTLSELQASRELAHDVAEELRVIRAVPTCRTLRFSSLADLHIVQQALTGYKVLFDGLATMFAIARRRMVVPIHKKWEAGTTRIQVVAHPDSKVVQLLAFFHEFHYGQCMSFVLKSTDVFETFGRGNKAGIKFDDAKFPLPRTAHHHGSGSGGSAFEANGNDGGGGDGAGSARSSMDFSRKAGPNDFFSETAFVCLDMPDLPGEHDDITIMFDNEADRDRLASCLPSPVRGSRLVKMF